MAEKGADWGMIDKKIQQDYVVTMTARLMNMQAHLTHGKNSNKKKLWYVELTKTDVVEPKELDEIDAPDVSEDIEDKGFNKELLECWRKLKGCKIEMADCVEIGKEDHDPVTAVFKDGARLVITDCTTSQYKKWIGAAGERKTKTTQIDAWAGEHIISKNQISVRERTDRTKLMSMYEQKLQILQVNVSTFHIKDEADNLAIEKAGKFMASLAEDYALDKIQKENLKAERDKRLMKLGLGKKTWERKLGALAKKEAIRESVLFYEIPGCGEIINN